MSKAKTQGSHCGPTGSVASLEHWDTGSSPGPDHGLRIWCSRSCRVGLNCSPDLIPGLGTLYTTGWSNNTTTKAKKAKGEASCPV